MIRSVTGLTGIRFAKRMTASPNRAVRSPKSSGFAPPSACMIRPHHSEFGLGISEFIRNSELGTRNSRRLLHHALCEPHKRRLQVHFFFLQHPQMQPRADEAGWDEVVFLDARLQA